MKTIIDTINHFKYKKNKFEQKNRAIKLQTS